MALFGLVAAAFFTSMLTAVVGLGGGVVLMLVLPGLLPLSAIVPVHAIVQTVSNASRVVFALEHVSWQLLPPVLLGAVAGASLGAQVVDVVSLQWLPAVSGFIILLVTWVPLHGLIRGNRFALVLLGFYQTGLGMLAGATGPLGAAVLAKINLDREWLVVNTGLYMTVNHCVRALAFGLLGFSFSPWWLQIGAMSMAMIGGAFVGTKLRQRVPQRNFAHIFRWLVTLLAIRMMALTFLGNT